MRSLTLIVVFCLFSCAFAVSASRIKNYADHTDIEIRIESLKKQLTQIGKEEFLKLELKGVEDLDAIHYELGRPSIPVVRMFVQETDSVEIDTGDQPEKYLKISHPVFPSQPSVKKVPTASLSPLVDREFYKQDEFWPATDQVFAPAGSVRGVKRYLMTLYPLSYNPKRGVVRWMPQLTIRVHHAQKSRNKGEPGIAFIVGKQFLQSPSLQKYRQWKQSKGFATYLIAADPDPVRTRAQLKDLQSAHSFQYGIIIGDHADVPGYEGKVIQGNTDHFYACLDQDDYLTDIGSPDISIGRISASNETELSTILGKNLRYDLSSPLAEWKRYVAFSATNDSKYWQLAEGTHNFVMDTFTIAKGFFGNFPTALATGGDRIYSVTHSAKEEDLVRSLQEGRSLVNYSGHGWYSYWANPHLSQEDVLSLNHPDALPFVVANACDTARFTLDSIGETWQRHEHGAIGYWGSIDSSYWDEDDILEKKMFEGIFQRSTTNFGGFTDYALRQLWLHYNGEGKSQYYWESYVLFGDPTIRLLTNRMP